VSIETPGEVSTISELSALAPTPIGKSATVIAQIIEATKTEIVLTFTFTT